MVIKFVACDKRSSAGDSAEVTVSTIEELKAKWTNFEAEMTELFGRWYSDNIFVEGTDEEESEFDEWNDGLG
jgi:hypothetical protein